MAECIHWALLWTHGLIKLKKPHRTSLWITMLDNLFPGLLPSFQASRFIFRFVFNVMKVSLSTFWFNNAWISSEVPMVLCHYGERNTTSCCTPLEWAKFVAICLQEAHLTRAAPLLQLRLLQPASSWFQLPVFQYTSFLHLKLVLS